MRLFDAPTEIHTQTQGSAPGRQQQQSVRMNTPMFAPAVNWGMLPGGDVVVSHTQGYTLKDVGDLV